MMRRFLAVGLIAAVVCVGTVITVRTLLLDADEAGVAPVDHPELDGERLSAVLAGALRFPTISYYDRTLMDRAAFADLRGYLEDAFPRVHATLDREVIGLDGLLFTWTGSDPALPGYLLLAHQDVVAVETGTEAAWTHPAFAGTVADGYIWGRGTLDNKGSVIAILQAVDHLLARGFRPRRTVYLAFGADEEVGGMASAGAMAAALDRRGVRLDFVLDEGMAVVTGQVPGLDRPAAIIGIAEKGYLTLRLATTDEGGHSSMPPSNTAAGRLARALTRLEDNPLPASLDGVPGKLLSALAPHFSLGQRVAMANLWLSGPMVIGQLAQGRATNALIRTTTAITVVRSGDKDNVLPQAAEAFVNFRLRPGDSVDDVIAHVKDTVDDPAVTATVAGNATNASRISSLDSLGYRAIATAVGQVMPDAVVAPGMTLAGTDSKHYAALAEDVYRFAPLRLGAGDARRIHGTDERIGVANYVEMVRFYIQLMRNVDALTPAAD